MAAGTSRPSTNYRAEPLSDSAAAYLDCVASDFSLNDAARVKEIESTTNHDVKAIEYFIKEKLASNPELTEHLEFVHFACTSEDINNLAYALMLKAGRDEVVLPEMRILASKVREIALSNAEQPLFLAPTVNQPHPQHSVKSLRMFIAGCSARSGR